MSERIQYIDQLKGLSMLLVVMGHVCSKSFLIDGTSFNYFYSSFHMPLFMFLSGIFAYKNIAYWNRIELFAFVRKKFLRIVIPFIIWGGCFSLIAGGELADVYMGVNPSLWFLPALFYCMIFGFFTNKIISCIKISNLIYADVLVNAVVYILLLIEYKYINNYEIPFFLSFVKLYPFFIIGTWMSRYTFINKCFTESEIIYFVSIIAYVLCWVYSDILWLQIRFTGIFAIVILVNFFKTNARSVPNILAVVGKYSLEIYLFHWFLLPSLGGMSKWYYTNVHMDVDIAQNFLVLMVSSFIIACPIIFICILFSKIIQKNKYVRIIGFGIH